MSPSIARRVLAVASALVLLLIPRSGASAEVVISGAVVWPAGSTQVLTDNTRFTGSLTIEPGVTVLVQGPYQIRIGDGASLHAEGTAAAPIQIRCDLNDRWQGISLGQGAVGRLEHANLTRMQRAIVVLGGNLTARHITVSETNQFREFGGTYSLIRVSGGHLELTNSVIGPYQARDGNGGANGTGPGLDGSPAWDGSSLRVVDISVGGTAIILNNRFQNITGGRGGLGGFGRDGAQGAMGTEGTLLSPTGGPGGLGGRGGNGGHGGHGGRVEVIYTSDPGPVLIAQNVVHSITGGAGGAGGGGGFGGQGGTGGTGTGGVFQGGNGGPGGTGGTGGNGGGGGDSGGAVLLAVANASGAANTVRLVNNTAFSLQSGMSGAAGEGGRGGSGGSGGDGGFNPFGSGQDGPPGSSGTYGLDGLVGVPRPSLGVSVTSSNAPVNPADIRNNIIAFAAGSPGSRIGYSVLGAQNFVVGHEVCFNASQVFFGPIALLGPVLNADPLLNADLTLSPTSPAIDAGDNTPVPAELNGLDFAGNARFSDMPSVPDSGNGTGLLVDRGAFEAQGIVACTGDIADDFGTIGSDGEVSFGDFLALLGLVGPCPGAPGCEGDIADDFGTIGGDGQISFGDFLALLGLVGPCP